MKYTHTLARTVIVIILLAFIVLLGGLVRDSYTYVRDTVVDQAQQQLLLLAGDAAKDVDQYFKEHAETLQVLALNPLIAREVSQASPLASDSIAVGFLRDLFVVHPDGIRAIDLLDASGQRLHRYALEESLATGLATDAAALARVLREQQPYINPPQLQQDNHWYAEILVPIFYQQGLVGVIRLLIDFETIIQRFVRPLQPYQTGYAWTLNDQGLILWHPNVAVISDVTPQGPRVSAAKLPQLAPVLDAMRAGRSGTGSYDFPAWQDNNVPIVRKIIGYAPVESLNRQLSIGVTAEFPTFSSPIQRYTLHIMLLALLVVLVLAVAGGLFIRSLQRRQQSDQRLARLHALLSGANQAIVRHQDRESLLQAIFCSSHRDGLLPLTQITLADEDIPVATRTCGCDTAPAALTTEMADAVKNLSAQVLCTGSLQLAAAPAVSSGGPWPVRTLAAFPISNRAGVAGALVVGSEEINFFQAAETRLLKKLAEDIGFAVQYLDTEQRRHLAERVFENTLEAALITDANKRILWVNAAFTRITGYSAEEVVGQNPKLLSSGRHEPAFYQNLWGSLKHTGRWRGEIWNRTKNGDEYPEWLTISTVLDEQQQISHYVAVFADLREHRQLQEHINRLANYDPLTELPNRLLLRENLQHTLTDRGQDPLAVLTLDLDRFQHINESLGQQGGDLVLKQVAERLKGFGQFLARETGDEFVLLLTQLDNAVQAEQVAKHLLQRLSEPMPVMKHQFNLSASLGISFYPEDGIDVNSLLQRSDAALHHAKSVGGGAYRFYTEGLSERAIRRLTLESALRQALPGDELRLYYQPQVDLDSGKVVGVEALVRWQHPKLGLVSPAEFIPLAEETGLIIPIGEWVFRTACTQAQVWHQQGLEPLRIGVNLSARQFLQPDLITMVSQVLTDTGLNAYCLELEITESLLMENVEDTITTLCALKSLGVHLAIDDFGTGYSSLSYLKRFPLDRLKIDQSFVREIDTDPDDAAIALAVIAMAHSLRLKVIAEGVETSGHLAFLRANQCDEMQGYYFSRPLPANEVTTLLQQRHRLELEDGETTHKRLTQKAQG